jgi:WD40 repeat protein
LFDRGETVVWCLDFTPDGTRLAYGATHRPEEGSRSVPLVGVWDLRRQTHLWRRDFTEGKQVLDVRFCPSGECLLVGILDDRLRVWDTATWVERLPPFEPALNGQRIALSRPPVLVAYGNTSHGDVAVGTLASRKAVVLYKQPWGVEAVAFSAGSRWLASCDDPGTVVVFDLRAGREHWRFVSHKGPGKGQPPRGGAMGLAFHPDTDRLFTSGTDGMVRVWDVPDRKEVESFSAGVEEVDFLDLSPDGNLLALGMKTYEKNPITGTLAVMDLANKRTLTPPGGLSSPVQALRFTADGKTLGAAVGRRGIVLWKIEDFVSVPPIPVKNEP